MRTIAPVVAVASIMALALVAYLPALQAGYIWDDDSYLTANPHAPPWVCDADPPRSGSQPRSLS